MARQKTNKTAKRVKMSKPRGIKLVCFNFSSKARDILKQRKESRRSKRRMLDSKEVDKTIKKRLIKKIVNI